MIKKLQEEKKQLQKRVSAPAYCTDYITKGCFNPNCGLLHAEKDEVEKFQKNKKALAAAKKKAAKAARSQSAGN